MTRPIRRFITVAAVLASVLGLGAIPASASNSVATGRGVKPAAVGLQVAIIYKVGTDDAITIKNASTAYEALAIQYPYSANGVNNDIMVLEWVDQYNSDWVRIKPLHTYTGDGNVHNDQCLAVKGASTAAYAVIVQATCSYDSVNNDVWHAESKLFSENNSVYIGYQYKNLKSNQCITVKNAATIPGAQLIQYPCTWTKNATWTPDTI